MTLRWALQLAAADAAALAPLRLRNGIEVGEAGDFLWVRGPAGDERLERALQSLPALNRFEWLMNDALRPITSRITSDSLPTLPWQPLDRWLRAELPPLACPGEV